MITEEMIAEIIHDYLNNNLSEEDFIKIKNENPKVDWEKLIKEEKFYQNIFKANIYTTLSSKINQDIDTIEKRRKTTKFIGLGSILLILSVIGIYYSLPKKAEPKKIEQPISTSANTTNENINTDAIEEKLPILNNDFAKKTTPKTVENQNSKTEIGNSEIKKIDSSKSLLTENVETKTNLSDDYEKIYTNFQEKTSPKKDSSLVLKLMEPKVETETTAKPKTKNYILNIAQNERIEIEISTDDIVISIKNLNGKEILREKLQNQTSFFWDGYQKNGEKLTPGLYLYVIEKEQMVSKLGQITIIE